jgi:cobalamin biosynthesis protein CbiD
VGPTSPPTITTTTTTSATAIAAATRGASIGEDNVSTRTPQVRCTGLHVESSHAGTGKHW